MATRNPKSTLTVSRPALVDLGLRPKGRKAAPKGVVAWRGTFCVSPVLGIPSLFFTPHMPTKKCPHCAEEIQEQAVICKHCKTDLRDPGDAPRTSIPLTSVDLSNVIQIKSSLDAKQLLLFQSEFDKRKKSVGYAYVLYFLLGGLGGHAFYVDHRGSGFAYFLCTFFGFSLIINERSEMRALGGFLLLINAIHALYDLFTLASQTRKANEKIERDILMKFVASNA